MQALPPGERGPPLIKDLIHVCFTPDDSDEQLLYMTRSLRSILHMAGSATRSKLVFHIFGGNLTRLNNHVTAVEWRCGAFPSVRVYKDIHRHVTPKREVWSRFTKLKGESNYVRFYIAKLIDPIVDKFLYLDTDTIVVSDISRMYNAALSSGNYTIAAGLQNPSGKCIGMKHQYNMKDKRVKDVSLSKDDPVLASSVLIVNRSRWLHENRTAQIEYWLEQNWKKPLWYLGSLPPLILSFQKNWEILPAEFARDWKGHSCCPPRYHNSELFDNRSTVLHPFKEAQDPGIFEAFLGHNVSSSVASYREKRDVYILPSKVNMLLECPKHLNFFVDEALTGGQICLVRLPKNWTFQEVEEIGKNACLTSPNCTAVTISKEHSNAFGGMYIYRFKHTKGSPLYQATLFRNSSGAVQMPIKCETLATHRNKDALQSHNRYTTFFRL